ncbi:hypothetical protein [Xylella fastidiosa]|uniref:hypothetical protein n=1 Tax=Xylella fastidiosa TaxID=2371 RepID=UPI0012AE9AA2|nr:hypothetical protein [Xylella fastidiosa]
MQPQSFSARSHAAAWYERYDRVDDAAHNDGKDSPERGLPWGVTACAQRDAALAAYFQRCSVDRGSQKKRHFLAVVQTTSSVQAGMACLLRNAPAEQ